MTEDSHNPAEGTTKRPPPPALRGAVAVWLALAVFGLLIAGSFWANRSQYNQALLKQHVIPADKVDATVRALLLNNTIALALFAVAYIAFGVMLFRGRGWARIALTVVGVVEALLLAINGIAPTTALIFGLIISGSVLSWLPANGRWLAEMRAGRTHEHSG